VIKRLHNDIINIGSFFLVNGTHFPDHML